MFKFLLPLLLALPLLGQTNNTLVYVAVAPSGLCASRSQLRLLVPDGVVYTCQNGTWGALSISSSAGTLTSLTATSPIVATPATITTTGALSCPTCTLTIFSGTKALSTSALASALCRVETLVATGTLTTDVPIATFNANTDAVTGYIASTSGMLTIKVYPTADNINFSVCNNTSASITPGAVTLNAKVLR